MSRALPPNCRRIEYEERTVAAKSLSTQDLKEAYFAIYDNTFLDVVGSNPTAEAVLSRRYKFAHEAPVYVPEQDAVYFTSNVLRDKDKHNPHIEITKASRRADGTWTCEKVDTDVSMGNGAINYCHQILFCAQGTKMHPGGIVVMDTKPPYKTKTLVDGYHGRLFNSVNDIVTHTDGSIWFTDPTYGFEQDFREKPKLPNQVYRFDPETGDIRVVADGFGMPNGLCFSPDEQTMYITDTDAVHPLASEIFDPTRRKVNPNENASYAFDVIKRHGSHFLTNRRVFAMADTWIPDGIKCDLQGNVYSGCGDGVNVWNAGGRLIGKIMIPSGSANFCFMRPGEILILSEEKVWVAKISDGVQGALLHNLGIEVKPKM
ncbi:hypothetical protein LTR73_000711 [Friedmanniomyces endolithicus]|nr:hypothetical protein LTR73_000711 [Friedmanniomyces endolithicus]